LTEHRDTIKIVNSVALARLCHCSSRYASGTARTISDDVSGPDKIGSSSVQTFDRRELSSDQQKQHTALLFPRRNGDKDQAGHLRDRQSARSDEDVDAGGGYTLREREDRPAASRSPAGNEQWQRSPCLRHVGSNDQAGAIRLDSRVHRCKPRRPTELLSIAVLKQERIPAQITTTVGARNQLVHRRAGNEVTVTPSLQQAGLSQWLTGAA